MTCHCFLRPIKRDLTSSFYTAHANACFVHCLSAFICSSHFAGTAFKSSRASTYHVYVKRSGHMIEPCGRRNQSSKISKYDRSPNSGPVNTPIIWTAANSQAKIYYKTQLLESRLALTHGQILTQVLVLSRPINVNPDPVFSLFCLKAFSWIIFPLLLEHPIINSGIFRTNPGLS